MAEMTVDYTNKDELIFTLGTIASLVYIPLLFMLLKKNTTLSKYRNLSKFTGLFI